MNNGCQHYDSHNNIVISKIGICHRLKEYCFPGQLLISPVEKRFGPKAKFSGGKLLFRSATSQELIYYFSTYGLPQ